jgi:hypothetical protein
MEFTTDTHPATCIAAENLGDLCTGCIAEYENWLDERAAEYASA